MIELPKKILLTGVAGFLGSHLLDKLLRLGHEVVGIDNLSMGKLENIAGHLSKKGFQFLQKDVTEQSTFSNLDNKFDCIVHLSCFQNSALWESYRYSKNELSRYGECSRASTSSSIASVF